MGASWGIPSGNNVLQGTVDPSASANLPSNPRVGDRYVVAQGTSGSFENSTLLEPQGYPLGQGDGIEWTGSKWQVKESGEDVWITGGTITGITDLAVADGGTGASNAGDARTNLDVDSKAEVTAKVDAHGNRTDNPHNVTAAQTGAPTVAQANNTSIVNAIIFG